MRFITLPSAPSGSANRSGLQVPVVNLPGGAYLGVNYDIFPSPRTWFNGKTGFSAEGHIVNGFGISLGSNGGYIRPADQLLTISAFLSTNKLEGDSDDLKGVGLGFYNATQPFVGDDGAVFAAFGQGFTGLQLEQGTGDLELVVDGATTGRLFRFRWRSESSAAALRRIRARSRTDFSPPTTNWNIPSTPTPARS